MILFEIRKSKIQGFGNFALQDIEKNTNLGIGLKQINNSGNSDNDFIRYNLCKYTNHSDEPNIFYRKDNNYYYFYTKRKLIKGEELFIDYNAFDFDGKINFKNKLKRLKKN